MTDDDKKLIQNEARSHGFKHGIEEGRRLADTIDTLVYSDQADIFIAGVFFDEYVKAFIEGLERAFKRRADEHAMTRWDIRRDKQRRMKKAGKP